MTAKKELSSALDEALASMVKPKLKPEILLAALDDLLRNRPTLGEIYERDDDAIAWIGRAAAVLGHYDDPRARSVLSVYVEMDIHTGDLGRVASAHSRLVALLNEFRHSILLSTAVPLNVAVASGQVFDYFDEVRKIVERTTVELFFVDPYLDADFVSR
jgi:hypothetical protein